MLNKIRRHIHAHQQHRLTLGIGMKLPVDPAIVPPATEPNDAIALIAIDSQDIAGARQIDHIQRGQSQRIVARAIQIDGFNVADPAIYPG